MLLELVAIADAIGAVRIAKERRLTVRTLKSPCEGVGEKGFITLLANLGRARPCSAACGTVRGTGLFLKFIVRYPVN